jgi:hypothetical protein
VYETLHYDGSHICKSTNKIMVSVPTFDILCSRFKVIPKKIINKLTNHTNIRPTVNNNNKAGAVQSTPKHAKFPRSPFVTLHSERSWLLQMYFTSNS